MVSSGIWGYMSVILVRAYVTYARTGRVSNLVVGVYRTARGAAGGGCPPACVCPGVRDQVIKVVLV